MDVEEYLKQYKKELESGDDERTRYREFLNKSRSVSERLEGLESSANSSDQDEVSESINIIRDRDEDVQIRVTAIRGISNEIGESPELIDLLLSLVRDNTEPVALREPALRVLQQLSFSSVVFRTKRPEYLDVLRSIIDDQDAELRQQAIGVLAKEKDEYVQRRLLEGLEDPSKALIPPEKAIQMLGFDIHAEHYPILRDMVKSPPNPAAKKEAVRLLAADAASKNMLAEILSDKGEDKEVRRTSAIALESLDPAEFEDRAKQIALDEDESDDLRATSLSGLGHFSSLEAVSIDSSFDESVAQLRDKTASEDLRRAAEMYMNRRGGRLQSTQPEELKSVQPLDENQMMGTEPVTVQEPSPNILAVIMGRVRKIIEAIKGNPKPPTPKTPAGGSSV